MSKGALAAYLSAWKVTQTGSRTGATVAVWGLTWYVAPAGVVELAAEVLAESRQIRFPVWHLIHVRRVEQHLAVGGAARTLDLLQETTTLGVVGGEDLRVTGRDGLRERAPVQDRVRRVSAFDELMK